MFVCSKCEAIYPEHYKSCPNCKARKKTKLEKSKTTTIQVEELSSEKPFRVSNMVTHGEITDAGT